MFKLNQSKGLEAPGTKQPLEKGDFELQEANGKTSCKWIHDSCCKSKSDLLL